MKIQPTTGYFENETLDVIYEDDLIVRAAVPGVGTICFPKRSKTTGIDYFTEVHDEQAA